MKSYPNANYKGVIMANLAIDNIILTSRASSPLCYADTSDIQVTEGFSRRGGLDLLEQHA